MPELRSGGVAIRYDDRGSGGPALLLLPGWCTSRKVFDRLAPLLATRRRTLTIDWRGHGETEQGGDFTSADLVEDALALIAASGVSEVIPVSLSHAGFVSIELRRRLGGRVPRLVFLDWIILDPPPPFLGALQAMQHPDHWRAARDGLFGMWLAGVDQPEVIRYVHEDMGSYPGEMWGRGAREILASYQRHGNPLQALAALTPPAPALHLYAQPDDPGYLAAQQGFAAQHPWFQVERLAARSHFPMIEAPELVAAAIEKFVSHR